MLQGHDSGSEKECGRTARKACLNGTFSSRFVRVLYSQSRAGRGLAFGGARRLCVRCAFTETAGAGISASVGPNERAALQSSRGAGSFLRCMSRRVHGAWKHAEKRASAGGLRMPETALFLPEEWGTLLQRGRPSRAAPLGGPVERFYTLTGVSLFRTAFAQAKILERMIAILCCFSPASFPLFVADGRRTFIM